MIRSAVKASISRTRSASASFSTNSISVILSSVIAGLRFGSKVSQPQTSTENRRWPPDVAPGRALRYAKGSARGLLHHQKGHNRARALFEGIAEGRPGAKRDIREAIGRWKFTMTVWTREAAPRKWGVLMHNIASAEELLGLLGNGDLRRYRAALASVDAAIEGLDPHLEPWTRAAAWAPRLRIAARLRTHF
jgi:hypothetical protein